MAWQNCRWNIPLENPPWIVQMGLAVHGLPVEHFRHHGDIWALHLHHYHATLHMVEDAFPIHPGCVTVVAPGTDMEFRFRGRSLHLFVLFRLPEATRVQEQNTVMTQVPAMQPVSNAYGDMESAIEKAMEASPTQPRRADAILWDLLWKLAEGLDGVAPTSPTEVEHQIVRIARQIIERRLGEPLRVAELAAEVGLSHNHLTRLFRATLGTTVIGYIQERRLQRAHHLLRNSTRPIKAIAAEVGLHDLQTLNKTMRRLGQDSPRAVRALGPTYINRS